MMASGTKKMKINEDNPLWAKLDMAEGVVGRLFGKEVARTEREWFEATFLSHSYPSRV